jgi:hypothetical protein
MSIRPPCGQLTAGNAGAATPGTPTASWASGRIFLLKPKERGLAYRLLECYYAVNTIGAEDAELAFVITAEVDETAVTLAGAG